MLYECHFQEPTEILGRLVESGEDATVLLEPTNQSLDDITASVCFTIKLNSTSISSSFAFEGMTGTMSKFIKYSSILSARYPLSPANATGHIKGGRKTKALVCLTDVYSTLEEITEQPHKATGGEAGMATAWNHSRLECRLL